MKANHRDGLQLELAKRGNAEAIDQLAREYWPEAYRAAVRIVRSHEDAEEIAQDSIWAAIRHLPAFREDSSFRTWVHRIVINHSLMALRRRRSRGLESTLTETTKELPCGPGGPRTPEQLLLEAECRTLIEEGISRLPALYSTVLRIVAREDEPMSCIAVRVGISTGTLKTRLHRGRQALRREIGSRLNSSAGLRNHLPEPVSMVAA
jgi:RNA polymerase sigma-70 factor (ECF subfamily)